MSGRLRDCPCIVGTTIAGLVVMATLVIALYVGKSVEAPVILRDLPRDQRLVHWPYWPALCSTYAIQIYPSSSSVAYFDLWHFGSFSDKLIHSDKTQKLSGSGKLSAKKYEPFFFHLLKSSSVAVKVTASGAQNVSQNKLEVHFFKSMKKFNDWTDGTSRSKPASVSVGCDDTESATCDNVKHFNITETDDYVIVLFNHHKEPGALTVDFEIDFTVKRAEYKDVKEMAGRRVASVQQRKEISGPKGWYVLTFPDDNFTPPPPGSPLESTEVKIYCEGSNPFVYFALFGIIPIVLLVVIGCITFKLQFRMNDDFYSDEERRRLLGNYPSPANAAPYTYT